MGRISASTGLITGFPIASTVSQLIQLESGPVNNLKTQNTTSAKPADGPHADRGSAHRAAIRREKHRATFALQSADDHQQQFGDSLGGRQSDRHASAAWQLPVHSASAGAIGSIAKFAVRERRLAARRRHIHVSLRRIHRQSGSSLDHQRRQRRHAGKNSDHRSQRRHRGRRSYGRPDDRRRDSGDRLECVNSRAGPSCRRSFAAY